MVSESFLKRVLMFIGLILSGLITLIFVSTPDSLDVPVPDSVPSITTKSSLARELEEAKKFFESSVSDKVPRASVASVVAWSPNSKYIFANLRFIDPTGSHTKPYILDLVRKKYVEVPNGGWVDAVSWSNNSIAYQTEKGYGYFDIATGESKMFGSSNSSNNSTAQGFPPIISSDGSYVAYSDNGLAVYSIKTSKAIFLTQNRNDIPLLWKADDKTLIIATTPATPGATNQKMVLSDFHIGTRMSHELVTLPQSIKRAVWVTRNKLALLTLGFDGGTFDYGFYLATNTLSLIAETSEGIAFTGVRDGQVATLKGNKITVYDSHLEKIADAKRTAKTSVANFSLLPLSQSLLVLNKDKGYDLATFNLKTTTETMIENIWLPYVVLSPSTKNAVTVGEGNDNVHFINIPQ